ncbi:MAG: Crp/Fnr family transcriptional regulator [Bacteroidetes bacterium]|nr:Crp/Fnr family transcriptional regulator [Bacteroidota bacterium]MBK7970215.1 Crp/Fnr family transcriptional regulator [Bacteroidota bacterium]MBK9048382.1 Crp/Fnr family transcriptional regulator [Bacteroidota bacterium]MBK9425471.1 Crp/Fnr family transcriptional regulator [Bacteroidota bacterium]MBL0073013.1 Crp/Fnr family transcriptional regulator [Bacteroidota bacterium]
MKELLHEKFKNIFEKELLDELQAIGKPVNVKAGDVIMDTGQYIKFIPLLLSGSIKIIRQDDTDGEILLYYVGSNETCAMSLTCCMAHQKSRIRAIAEEDTEMITVPVEKMDEWMIKYESWKNFVMQTYNARFDELLRTIDSIAFQKVDERLENYLKSKAELTESKLLVVSHQQIAEELNSSREVISRLLKHLEKNGKIKLGRNKIELMEL